jgi:hypothetical protein
MAAVTDEVVAWHYSEEKQQFHFTCDQESCKTETDILGEYGYCPACGRSNAYKVFAGKCENDLKKLEHIRNTVTDRHEREDAWEKITIDAVSKFEALGKHARRKLLLLPMTVNRRRELEALNFQQPLTADRLLKQWFDVGVMERTMPLNDRTKTQVAQTDLPFLVMMVQKRHVLIHNGGLVDEEYLQRTGETQMRLDERVRIRSREARRFIEIVRDMGMNLLDNIETGLTRE